MKSKRKRFGMALIFVVIFATLVFVTVGCASAKTHYVNPGESIQAAVNAADPDDTIIVRDGNYTENVNVNKRLTIQSENDSDLTIVQAASSNDRVFEIKADCVTIRGFTVKGATAYSGIYLLHADYCTISNNDANSNRNGIELWDSNNSRIENVTVSGNTYGIRLDYSNNNTLTDNTANSNDYCGIYLSSSSSNTLTNNKASNNEADGIKLSYYSNSNTINNNIANSNKWSGISLSGSSNNTLINNINDLNGWDGIDLRSDCNIINNNIANSNKWEGIYIDGSNNTLRNNTANLNWFGMCIRGSNNTLRNNTILGSTKYNFDASSIQDIDTSNKINGKSIRYLVHEKDRIIDSNLDVGYLGIVNSRNITVRDLILTNNSVGILLDHSSDAKIENITAVNCEYGIYLKSSSNNTVTNNKASYDSTGIYLQNASDNVISNNNASNNTIGIYLWAYSNNNTLTYNTVNFNRHYGIGFSNVISNNIYLNNFNNSKNVRPSGQTNTSWNSTSKITYTYNGNTYSNYMGNYWSDYNGSESNGDGIGDTPYCMDSHRDYRPLMQPWENYFAPALLVLDTGACTYPQHTSGKIYDN